VTGNGAQYGTAIKRKTDGDTPAIPAAREIGGAINGINDPKRTGIRYLATAFLTQDRLTGKKPREFAANEILCRAIGLGQEILRALQARGALAFMAQPRGKRGGIPRHWRQKRKAALQFGRVHV
jgi:hypothetical protein